MALAQLEAKRAEFWDTRVQGRAECWQAIKVAVEASETEGDMSTTQAILESAEMTPFEVERADTCFTYDAKGFKYEIPLYCVFKPSNLLPTAVSSSANNKPGAVSPAQPLVVAPAPVKAQPALVESDQKAQEIVTTGKPLSFKVRFSNGLPDLAVDQKTSCTIGQLKQLIQQKHPQLGPERQLRIYYLGKHMSQDRWDMAAIGMKSSMILQCFVVPGVFQKA